MSTETLADLEAQISRHQVLMENACDDHERRDQQQKFLSALQRRNALRSPDQVAAIEASRGLR